MWKQISITKPPINERFLFGYFDDITGQITRVEDAFYSIEATLIWAIAPWANVWMELPQSFEPGHL